MEKEGNLQVEEENKIKTNSRFLSWDLYLCLYLPLQFDLRCAREETVDTDPVGGKMPQETSHELWPSSTASSSRHSLLFHLKVQAAAEADLELRAAITAVKCSVHISSERELHLLGKRSC